MASGAYLPNRWAAKQSILSYVNAICLGRGRLSIMRKRCSLASLALLLAFCSCSQTEQAEEYASGRRGMIARHGDSVAPDSSADGQASEATPAQAPTLQNPGVVTGQKGQRFNPTRRWRQSTAAYGVRQFDSPVGIRRTVAPDALASGTDSTTVQLTGFGEAPQIFQVQTSQDTLLHGAEGTTLWLPANSFVQNDIAVRASVVEVQLREFYTLADILMQQLSTTANMALLETGGMVQLTATANGRPCALKQSAGVEVSFPAPNPQSGMELFYGINKPGHGLDWKPASARRQVQPQDFRAPAYPRGNGGMRRWLRDRVAYTAALAQRLNKTRRPRQLRRLLRRVGRDEQATVVAVVEADFELDAQGRLADVRIIRTSPNDSLPSGAVARAFKKMPRWRPATNGFSQTIRSQMHVQVLFTANRRVLVQYLDWDSNATHRMWAEDQAVLTGRNGQLPGRMETAMYAFPITKLGWINCDRFYNSPDPLITFVAAPNPAASVSLVFKAIRSIMLGHNDLKGNIRFGNVPRGAAATIVAIRQDKTQIFLAVRPVTIGRKTEPALVFHPVTPDELKAEIALLE